MLRELKQNPHRIVGMKLLETKATLTLVTEKGEEVQISNANYNFNDRYSNGSFIIDEATNGKVIELYEELKLEEDRISKQASQRPPIILGAFFYFMYYKYTIVFIFIHTYNRKYH